MLTNNESWLGTMLNKTAVPSRSWLFWILLLTAAAVLLRIAPQEQTLGEGIKSVYVHVGLIWAGMAGIIVAGLLGLLISLFANERLLPWMKRIGWVALAFYAAGVAMSALASEANWGSVFWQEPRMRVALNMLAAALIVELLIGLLPWIRIQGSLAVGLIVLLAWSTFNAPLVLHPRDPIRTSSSAAIQMSFLGFFVLSVLASAWFVWHSRPQARDSTD